MVVQYLRKKLRKTTSEKLVQLRAVDDVQTMASTQTESATDIPNSSPTVSAATDPDAAGSVVAEGVENVGEEPKSEVMGQEEDGGCHSVQEDVKEADGDEQQGDVGVIGSDTQFQKQILEAKEDGALDKPEGKLHLHLMRLGQNFWCISKGFLLSLQLNTLIYNI